MPYAQYSDAAVALLILVSPAFTLGWWWRSRQLRGTVPKPELTALLEVLLVASVIGIAGVSLFGQIGDRRVLDLNPFGGRFDSAAMRRQLIGNVLLPTPVAVFATSRFGRLRTMWAQALIGFGLMFALEGAQYVVGGRVASLQDVLAGTLGWTAASWLTGIVRARRNAIDSGQHQVPAGSG